MRDSTFHIQTMGCKVNTYDTSLLEKQLLAAGFTQDRNVPGIHIINSCAVTEKSSLETHRHVKQIKALHPNALVVITGCVAQVDIDRLRTLTGADLIIANSHKGQFEVILKDYLEGRSTERVFHSNIFKKEELDPGGGIESSRTRAFLKIQDGCNSFCSFCIIPFARGKSRSLSENHLVDRVNDLHRQGFQEVVLTGVHCGDYEDGATGFADLVEAVLKKTDIPRVRLSSLEPIEVTPKLWELFATQPRLCPHIHVSLQSGNSKVLSDMRRKYGQPEIRAFFETFQKIIPEGFIGMDVIVGFPGETDEDFLDTYEFLASQPWTRIHVFPYSIRPGTTASRRKDHLPGAIIQKRARRLRELSLSRQNQMAQAQIHRLKDVLILEKPSHGAQGLSRDYWPVEITDFEQAPNINKEIKIEVTGFRARENSEAVLVGRVANSP
jgi:threonylcarbamoyladenosine tRNA methylthiotransferase MtaB